MKTAPSSSPPSDSTTASDVDEHLSSPTSPALGRVPAADAGIVAAGSMSAGERLRVVTERIELARAFGEKLRHIRVGAGESGESFAERCGISPGASSKTARGQSETRLSLILILCDGCR